MCIEPGKAVLFPDSCQRTCVALLHRQSWSASMAVSLHLHRKGRTTMKRAPAISLLAFALSACGTAAGRGSVPAGYVPTPNGFAHQSCIREIPRGYRISQGGVVTSPAGVRETLA